ncbi:hypothetical protein [Vreelandella titanicae]|uniref:Uncharacterized protein n=1 Tax=Vreelandella titanicae TaxID=664683 RepID=A0AAP9NMF8_9GAMM|nr:hypothetical protein [Halomonas titanicae]QKS24767.1 hypothetical protein FX987_02549 [Halomonas titanicae]SDJ23486.1 hypothetical protein SAMN04487867_12936 [Halomonas titanicae]
MATRSNQQMCLLRVGFQHLILPASKGMKVMQELQAAVEAEWDYIGESDRYRVKGRPDLQLTLIDAHQVVMPEGSATPPRKRRPRQLTHD